MTSKERELYNALVQIAHRDCAGLCGMIARKAVEKMQMDEADEMIHRTEQVIETFDRVFRK